MKIYLLCSLALLVCACAKEDKPATLTLGQNTLTLHTLEQSVLVALDAAGERINGQNVEWQNSNPETVEVDSEGLIIAKQPGKATISATFEYHTATCEVTVEPNVYLAGFQQTDLDRSATYWKNGQTVTLTYHVGGNYSNAWSIFVNQGDVYVAGEVYTGTIPQALYWKNGVAVPLTNGSLSSRATSICVDGADVYVAGSMQTPLSVGATYWKNGVPTILSDGASASVIYANNGKVYVAGERHGKGLYWSNEQEFELPADGTTYVNDIFVTGNDIYVAGRVEPDNKQPIAQYWKNGVPVALTDGVHEANLNSIWVDGEDIYVAGEKQTETGMVPTYWKNGIAITLGRSGGAYSITVHKGQVFVAGYENRNETLVSAKYWQNGKEVYMPKVMGNVAVGTSIYVE